MTLRVSHPNEKLDTITSELGLQPDCKWQAGQPRATPVGTPLPGVNRDTYWAYCERIARHRKFFETVVELLARLEAAEEFVWGLLRSGGRVNLIVHLPGRTNIGDTISPADLLRMGRLGIGLAETRRQPQTATRFRRVCGWGVEVFPDMQ